MLNGSVQSSNAAGLTTQWKVYSGPAAATFGNATQTNTSVTFNAPGQYVLMLSADNGIHGTSYDAAVITVPDAIQLGIARAGTNIVVRWTGGTPPFELQRSPVFPATTWITVGTFSTNSATVPLTPGAMYFRVRGQ
jgi:hypothetical protein